MALDDFVQDARDVLRSLAELRRPIGEIGDGRFLRDLSADAHTERNLSQLGALSLGGEIRADVLLILADQPHLELDAWQDLEPEPHAEAACAALRIRGSVEAGFDAEEALGGGVRIHAGVKAGGSVELVHHRVVRQDAKALDALETLFDPLKNPYEPRHLRTLAEGETLQVEILGRAILQTTAGWSFGFVERFDGADLEKLDLGGIAGLEANVTAGLTFKAGLDGSLMLVVTASDRHPGWVRVQLHKKRGRFVGAGLSLQGGAQLTQIEPFVESILGRLLEVPDGFVTEVREILQRYAKAREMLDNLPSTLAKEIGHVLGKSAEALQPDDLEALSRHLGGTDGASARASLDLSDEARSWLETLRTRFDRLRSLLERSTAAIQDLVDTTFSPVTTQLDNAAGRLAGWLAAYDDLRRKAAEHLQKVADRRLRVEIESTINRTRSGEALLDLDFDLELAEDLCLAALKGNFAPALGRAQQPGASGVELRSGVLKDTVRTVRHRSLRLNLLGFETRTDFENWRDVEITDRLDGDGGDDEGGSDVSGADDALYVTGQSGAKLTAENRRRARELTFLFDLYGAAEQRATGVFLRPEAGFEAALIRTATLHRPADIEELLPGHLFGAERLGLLDREERRALQRILETEEGPYGYRLELRFPTRSLGRVFQLDTASSATEELELLLWNRFREALEILDVEVPFGKQICRLSRLMTRNAIDEVRFDPQPQRWTSLRFLRVDGRSLPDGALRHTWAYLQNAHFFVQAFLRTRTALLGGESVHRISNILRQMASQVANAPGVFGTRPLDAKYLTLALLEGRIDATVRLTFHRGAKSVTL